MSSVPPVRSLADNFRIAMSAMIRADEQFGKPDMTEFVANIERAHEHLSRVRRIIRFAQEVPATKD